MKQPEVWRGVKRKFILRDHLAKASSRGELRHAKRARGVLGCTQGYTGLRFIQGARKILRVGLFNVEATGSIEGGKFDHGLFLFQITGHFDGAFLAALLVVWQKEADRLDTLRVIDAGVWTNLDA